MLSLPFIYLSGGIAAVLKMRSALPGIVCLMLVVWISGWGAAQHKEVVRLFMPQEPVYQQQMERLIEAALPHIDVQVDGPSAPGMQISYLELAERLTSGQYDAVIMSGTFAPYYINEGLLASLDPIVLRTGFFHPVFDSMRADGQLFDLPTVLDVLVVLYNQGMFNRVGLPLPDAGWTWDDFVDAAVRLSDREGPQPVYGAVIQTSSLLRYMLHQVKSDLIDVDDHELRYAVSTVSRLLQGDAYILDGTFSRMYVRDGEAAMQILPHSVALAMISSVNNDPRRFDWGIAPLPTMPGRQAVNLAGSLYTVGIAANAANPGAAWEVVRFIATEGTSPLGSSLEELPAFLSQAELQSWAQRVTSRWPQDKRVGLFTVVRQPNVTYGRGSLQAGSEMGGELRRQTELLMNRATTANQALEELRQLRDRLRGR